MTSLSKKPVAKKRGRPAGSKNKPAAKPKTFKQKEINIIIEDLVDAEFLCEKMTYEIEAIELKIKNLEHKAMQYEVVIDYLETKLEIK
jgi:hypothetical protein